MVVAILGGGKKKNIAICDNRLKVLLGGYGIDKKNLDLFDGSFVTDIGDILKISPMTVTKESLDRGLCCHSQN